MSSDPRTAAAPQAGQPRIPIVVLGGFLGSGKTTLLNALLRRRGLPRLSVLVNDFGALQVDASLIRARSDDIIELDNGCICCSLGEALMQRLLDIAQQRPAPELLLIEASGVSDPLRIAQVGLLDPAFSLQAVVVAVDAQHYEQQFADAQIGGMLRRQVAGASVLALTHVDVASAERVRRVRRLLEQANPRAPVVEAPRGELARQVFLDGPAVSPRRPGLSLPDGDGRWRAAGAQHGELGSFVLRTRRAFEPWQLKEVLRALPWRVLRAKGFVRLHGRPGWWLLQMVCGRIALSPAPVPQRPGLVLLGCFSPADHASLEARLRDAQVDPATARGPSALVHNAEDADPAGLRPAPGPPGGALPG